MFVGFEVLTSILLKIVVFWVVMPYNVERAWY
jgi:hypothetical protein